jgi:hypothetical protein
LISFRTVSGVALPTYFRLEGASQAYRITSNDGTITYVRPVIDALALMVRLCAEETEFL